MAEAYFPPPQAYQRETVDNTFKDLVGDARAMKGSVFDTAFDKAVRFGAGDAFGGMGPQGVGMVGEGWTSPLGRALQKVLGPELMGRIEQAPAKLNLALMRGKVLNKFGRGSYGITLPENYEVDPAAAIRMLKEPQGPINTTAHVGPIANMTNVAEQTGAHEAFGHGIPMIESGRPLVYSNAGGMNVIQRELTSPTVEAHTPQYVTRLLQYYGQGAGGPMGKFTIPHAAIELEANRLAQQGGFEPLVRGTELPTFNPRLWEQLKQGAR